MEKIKCVSMPSRAYTSFLHAIGLDSNSGILTVSMPSRAYTSFLQLSCEEDTGISVPVSMPSRAYTSFLQRDLLKRREPVTECVNALSGLYLISTPIRVNNRSYCDGGVNALSGLYLISTCARAWLITSGRGRCVNALSGLYLISTIKNMCDSAYTDLCQCPLGLIPHFYGTPSKA